MIRSILMLRPRTGDGSEIADFYRRHRVLERAVEQDGCFGAELQLPIGGAGDVVITALWRDADAYRGWLESPDRAASAAELGQLVEGFNVGVSGSTYEVVIHAEPSR